MPFASAKNVKNATYGLFGFVIVALLYVSIREPAVPEAPVQADEEDCIGTPIVVDYAYQGGVNTPHECIVQCEDDLPRYIQYSNGKAAQCDTPPSCLDYGEDHRITCKPPAAMSTIE